MKAEINKYYQFLTYKQYNNTKNGRNAHECHAKLQEAVDVQSLFTQRCKWLLLNTVLQMKGVGLWQNYPHILVFLHQQCSEFFRRTWRCASFVQSGCRMHYETCRINLEQIQHEGNDMLNQITAINETWAQAYEPELVIKWMALSWFTMETQVSTESITHEGARVLKNQNWLNQLLTDGTVGGLWLAMHLSLNLKFS